MTFVINRSSLAHCPLVNRETKYYIGSFPIRLLSEMQIRNNHNLLRRLAVCPLKPSPPSLLLDGSPKPWQPCGGIWGLLFAQLTVSTGESDQECERTGKVRHTGVLTTGWKPTEETAGGTPLHGGDDSTLDPERGGSQCWPNSPEPAGLPVLKGI